MTTTSTPRRATVALVAVLAMLFSTVPPLAGGASADEHVLALFDFDGETVDPSVVGDGVDVGPMQAARGATNFFAGNPGDAFATTQWHEDDNYFEFEVTPDEGVEVLLDGLAFDQNASGTGPTSWAVLLVTDGEQVELGSGTTSTTFGSRSVDIAEQVADPQDGPFRIRIAGFGASGSGGTWRIDNVTLTRATGETPDPEEVVHAFFDFEAPDAADKPFPTEVGDGVDVGPMTIGRDGAAQTFPLGSQPPGNGGSAMSSNQWHEGDNHFEFEVTPHDGVEVTPTTLRFHEAASGTGPQSWTAYLVVDDELLEIGTGTTGTTSPLAFGIHEVAIPAGVVGPYEDTFSVRLVGEGASGSTGTWRIDNVELVEGDVAPPPVISLVEYDFEGDTTEPSHVANGVTAEPMTVARGSSGFVLGNPGRAFTSNQWHEGDNYFELEVAPDEGVDTTLESFAFDQNASGTGPTSFAAFLVVDDVEVELGSGDASTDWGSREVAVPPDVVGPYAESFSIRLYGLGASGSGGTWRIDNVVLTGSLTGDVPPAEVSLECQAPFTITEGYAADDSEYVRGKAITATASDGTGELDFTVTEVVPDPAAGEVTVTDVDGDVAEVRFSDDVPGLDPIDTDGTYEVTVQVEDAEGGTDTCTVDVRVVPVLNIGELRGVVEDDANGRTHRSPYALGSPVHQPGDPIAVRGVVTQRLMEENAGGDFDFEGFFIQSLDAVAADIDGFEEGDPVFADGDHRTSDGLWVSTGTFSTVRPDFPSAPPQADQYEPQVGDVVTLRGPVVEDFSQTTLRSLFVVDVATPDETGVQVDDHVEVAEVDPPDDEQQASVYWERLAGMQVEVPEDAVVVSGNDFFAPSTSEFWVIRGDHPVALRDDPDARRVFRSYHPLANEQVVPEDGAGDQTGFRILLGSFGIKGATRDATATITPARSGDTLTEARQGGVYFAFSKYQIMVDEQPALERGPDPSASSLTAVDGFDPAEEYSVMVYNVENLYDFRSDPFSGCDLDEDVVPDGQVPTSTCTADEPGGSTVTMPFTYAPRTQEAYDEQRIAIAEQILVALDAPDIITIQEAEKQDVCVPVYDEDTPADSHLVCDLSEPADGETMENTDRGSGAPDTVEELALEIFIQSDGAIRYEASGDAVNGRDVRGITQAFLHRTDRVELVPVDELHDDPVLGQGDAIDLPYPSADERTPVAPWVEQTANPKAVNAELPEWAKDAAADLGESIDGGRFPQTQYAFSRAAQVAKFRVFPDGVDAGGPFVERYVTSNHMSAGPDGRTAQRTEQARLNAAIADAARAHGGQVLVTGDFNVFPRPDDPFPSFLTDPDREPSDQLAPMYERGFTNLHDVIIEEAPANTYSFIFQGISQILDHIFVDDSTLDEVVVARYIHVNTDYPAETPGFEAGRGASDHDPLYARLLFNIDDADPGPPPWVPGPPPWSPGPPPWTPGPPPWFTGPADPPGPPGVADVPPGRARQVR